MAGANCSVLQTVKAISDCRNLLPSENLWGECLMGDRNKPDTLGKSLTDSLPAGSRSLIGNRISEATGTVPELPSGMPGQWMNLPKIARGDCRSIESPFHHEEAAVASV